MHACLLVRSSLQHDSVWERGEPLEVLGKLGTVGYAGEKGQYGIAMCLRCSQLPPVSNM